MELFLNLCWLSLLLPAWLLWRCRTASGGPAKTPALDPLIFVCALGCVLVLLFPVISASDDLHAIRAEMEDSSISKRTVRQAGNDKNSGWVSRLQGPLAAVASAVRLVAPEVGLLDVSVEWVSPLARPCIFHGGRAPPLSLRG
jgi:hypothetical protein